MEIKLLHHTKDYHKLVECVARVCYDSYSKDAPNSHNFIKAIMAKGHISVSSVGNMVFEFDANGQEELMDMLIDLTAFHEITQFVKWTFKDQRKNPDTKKAYISMNMLTFLDIYNERNNFNWQSDLLRMIVSETDKVPYLKWFYDKSVQLEESPNEYTAKGTPSLYEPIVLDEDYTALKALGLTDYELGIHASITMNFITDRAAGLQFWRHWAGGCELSQRYVERGNAEFREMVGLAELMHKSDNEAAKKLRDILIDSKEDVMFNYATILNFCEEIGIRKNRAKEIARSILPNNITTQIIQSRPYRNWQHLFNLRDTNHAQAEIREDVRAMKRVLLDINVIHEQEVDS